MMDGITLRGNVFFLRKSNACHQCAQLPDAERCVNGEEYLNFNRKNILLLRGLSTQRHSRFLIGD